MNEINRRPCMAKKDCTIIIYADYMNQKDCHYDWIPPTDEERAMFRDGESHDSIVFCVWYDDFVYVGAEGCGVEGCAAVSSSLALDGADCDNMPDGYE